MKRLAFRLAVASVTFSLSSVAAWMISSRIQPKGASRAKLATIRPANTPIFDSTFAKITSLPEPMDEGKAASVQFVDQATGWLSINNKLWRTKDGGSNWEALSMPASSDNLTTHYAIQFQFVTSQLGWLRVEGNLFRTNDGGDSWKSIEQPVPPDDRCESICGLISFALAKDGQHGWIVGKRFRPLSPNESYLECPHAEYTKDAREVRVSVIYYTVNGGETWVLQPINSYPYGIDTIVAIDQTHALTYGEAGVFYLDNLRWRPVRSDERPLTDNSSSSCLDAGPGAPSVSPISAYFINARVGWLMNSNGYLGRTTDGGTTWTDISTELGRGYEEPNMYGMKVQFLPNGGGWAIDGDGKLRNSTSGGVSWILVGPSMVFADIFVLDEYHGWAVSNEGIYQIPPASGGN